MHLFVAVRIAYGFDSEIVAIVDGGCTHVFVAVRIAYGDDSKIVAIDYGELYHICL